MKLDFESNISTYAPVGSGFSESFESDNNNSFEVSKMLREGIEAAQNGKAAEARNLLLRVTEAEPKNEKAWLWLASISEYPEELLIFLNNVLKINPENEKALEWAKATKSLLSKTFVQRGIDASGEDGDFAKQCFLQAIVHDNQNEMAWLWLASVANTDDEKLSHLQKVLNLNPNNETAKNLLEKMSRQKSEMIFQEAAMFAAEGENEKALNALEDYFCSGSQETEKAWLLKSFLVNSFEEKSACFEQVLEVNPENELARLNTYYLRSMMEKPASEEAESELQMTDPEAFAAVEESENLSSPDFEEESEEEVFASEETHLEEELKSETHLDETEAPQFSMTEDENFSMSDGTVSESENFEMQMKFDESSAEEMSFEQSEPEELLKEETELQSEYSDEMEEDEKGYAFYEEEEKIADVSEPQESYFTETGYSYEEPESEVFADPESQTESYENVQEMPQMYDFQPDSTSATQPDFSENETREFSLNDYLPNAEDSDKDVYEIESAEAVAENNYSHLFEETETQNEDSPSELSETMTNFGENQPSEMSFESSETQAEKVSCVFCSASNETNSLVCYSCRAVLTLSDLEMILANQEADKEMIGNAIYQLTAEGETRDLASDELKQIALGYLNIGDLPKGLSYLNEAGKMNPDDIVLSSQINGLKIRHAEIEKQKDIHDSMPKNLTILVVDDSATVRKLISGKLEKSGHEVVCAIDGIDALEKIKEMVPDLVLLDINMPRMDGYQVCKMIRGNNSTKDVPVVMISGKDGFFDKVRGRMAGTTGYITKPFGPETLMKTVETYIV